MGLRDKVMDILCDPEATEKTYERRIAFSKGHGVARQAAAQVAAAGDEAMAEAANIIRELCAAYGHPEPTATLERLEGGVDVAGGVEAGEAARLRVSLAAIHARVCNGSSTYGMGEAIAVECESAVPSLRKLRNKVVEPLKKA